MPRKRKVLGRVGPKVEVGKKERALAVGRSKAFGDFVMTVRKSTICNTLWLKMPVDYRRNGSYG